MLTANKGEWSEAYALFKILAEKKVYAGDENLNKILTLFYPIIKVIKEEEGEEISFEVEGDDIKVKRDENQTTISSEVFRLKAEKLFKEISDGQGPAFQIPETENFMASVYCKKVTASSKDKADIKVVVHDLRTGITPTLGFSIKSQLGAAATLLNANIQTNFTYQVYNVNESLIEEFNKTKLFKNKFQLLENNKSKFQFFDIESRTFKNNLLLIDNVLPQILSESLLYYYQGSKIFKVGDICNRLTHDNPLNFDLEMGHPFYEQKIKRLLSESALGMTAAKVWTGIYDATGGYMIVKEDGDVLVYHIFSKNLFESYLFNNTRFETGSTSKHKFGQIFENNGKFFFNLNLQIRFI